MNSLRNDQLVFDSESASIMNSSVDKILFMWAIFHNYILMCIFKYKVSCFWNLSHCDVFLLQSGSTALMYAASADFPYTCNELLVRGADLTLTNDYDQDAYTLTTTNNCKLGNYYFRKSLLAIFYDYYFIYKLISLQHKLW